MGQRYKLTEKTRFNGYTRFWISWTIERTLSCKKAVPEWVSSLLRRLSILGINFPDVTARESSCRALLSRTAERADITQCRKSSMMACICLIHLSSSSSERKLWFSKRCNVSYVSKILKYATPTLARVTNGHSGGRILGKALQSSVEEKEDPY